MNKNAIIAILGILVGVMAITMMIRDFKGGQNGGGHPNGRTAPDTVTNKASIQTKSSGPVADTNMLSVSSTSSIPVTVTNTPPPPPATNPLPVLVERELPPVKDGDVDRLPRKDEPQGLTTLFEVAGKGTLAAASGAGDVSFYYLMKTVATSKIEDKEEFDSGKIKVTEIRSFSEATEVMKVSDVNLRVDLSTVPVDAIANTGYLVGGIASLFDPELGLSITKTVADFRDTIDSFDGMDAKPVFDMLKGFGIDVQRIISEPVEKYLQGLLKNVHSHVNAVTGKSYRFIYWTDKAGEPLRVRYENVDHSPISLEEQNVLNYVNLFIDCHVLPDKNCRPGHAWPINPASIGTMFGAVADGTCSGEITVRRVDDGNRPDGNWELSIDPVPITFYSKDRLPVGNVKLRGGKGIGDGRRAILRELQVDGTGKFRKEESNTYFWVFEFIKKTEGDCQFRSTISPRIED
ncbi:MAG: hypothetical protein IKR48_05430 [Kiritimatiellae bacterium]|nr:hypothetical protein [Kiritimatiellia bacterium]